MGAGSEMGSRGSPAAWHSPAAPAASLPWEVLAAIDVASVPVCVSLCVPATGRPCPLAQLCQAAPHPCQGTGPLPAGSCAPGFGRWPRCQLSGSLGTQGRWLCRGGVPLSPLQTFCTQGLEEVVAMVHLQTGLHNPRSRGGGFERAPEAPHGSLCCARRLSLLSPFPQPQLPSPAARQGGGGRSHWWPLSEETAGGVCGVTPLFLVLGTQGSEGLSLLLGGGA